MGKKAARAGNSVPRRHVLEGLAATGAAMTGAAAGARTAVSSSAAWDAIVIGAGVFGSWTAWTLQRAGHKVLLLDAWGAAHNRASSGGETRLIRTEYAGNALYTRWAWASLAEWQALSKRHESPILDRKSTRLNSSH